MTRDRLRLGEEGERLASRYLEERGYRILARRWRGAGREIDLIAEKGGVVSLVEVELGPRDDVVRPQVIAEAPRELVGQRDRVATRGAAGRRSDR